MEQNNKIEIDPHALARMFEAQIKDTIVKKFSVAPDDLSLLLGDEDGVYLSEEEANTLCCFVVGADGFMYLVTAHIREDGKSLGDFKSDIVS